VLCLALMLHTVTCRPTCSLTPADTAEALSVVLASLTAAALCSWLVNTWTALCAVAWRSMATSTLKWNWKSCSQDVGFWWTRSWASLARAPTPMYSSECPCLCSYSCQHPMFVCVTMQNTSMTVMLWHRQACILHACSACFVCMRAKQGTSAWWAKQTPFHLLHRMPIVISGCVHNLPDL